MLDDLTKEIKAQLYERVKSPLFGAFALSWVAWNYRALLAVASKMSFQETLAYLDSVYPSGWEKLAFGLGAPLLTAVVFLLVYPYPARWMYRYWASQHKELKKVQQQIEDDTPMTQEEARALRKASLTQVAELDAEISKQRLINKELNERLRSAAEDVLRITGERDQFAEDSKKTREELSQHLAEVLHEAPVSATEGALEAVARAQQESSKALGQKFNEATNPFPNQPVGYPLPKSPEEFLGGGSVGAGSTGGGQEVLQGDSQVFHALMRLGSGTTEEIATVADLGTEKAYKALLNLVRLDQATRAGNVWAIGEKGKLIRAAIGR